MSRFPVRLGLLAPIVLLAACSTSPGAGIGECIPGVVLACRCAGGGEGTQACRTDRTPEPCVCSGEEPAEGAEPDPTGDADLWLDFGTVPVGDRAFRSIPLRNTGDEELVFRIETIGAPFRLETESPVVLAPGQQGELRWSYAPTAEGTSSKVLTVNANGSLLLVRLAGRGFAPRIECETDRVDFGMVLRGREERRELRCYNLSTETLAPVVGPLGGDDPEAFRLDSPSPGPVPRDGTFTVALRAVPGENDILRAVLPITSPGGRELRRVLLEVQGFSSGLSCEPLVIDFGYVDPGAVGHRPLVCRNRSNQPVAITGMALDASSNPVFSWSPDSFPLEVPARSGGEDGILTIDVALAPRPDDAGRSFNGILVVSTDDPSTPRYDVALTGHAGGPELSCDPLFVDFGWWTPGLSTTRTITCTNVGEDFPGDGDRLRVWGIEGDHGPHFTATVPGGIPAEGYEAGESFTIEVTYHPADAGFHVSLLRIGSNATNVSPTEGLRIGLQGEAIDLPPCSFALTPDSLRFGNVEPGASRTIEFAIRNRRAETSCLVHHLRLAPTCDASFSLPAGELDRHEVPAAGELRIPVRFAPVEHGTAPFTCDVLFEVSDPDDPHQAIRATGLSVASCLAIEPAQVDFGGWKPGCAPRRRDLRIRNGCDTPVRIGRVEVESLGGEFSGVWYPGEGEEVPAFDEIPLVTVQYAPTEMSPDPVHGTVFVYPAGGAEPIGASLLGRVTTDAWRSETFTGSAESCFPLADRPEDSNGNGTISGAEGELEVRLDGQEVPPVNGQGQAIWSYRSETNAVCFEPGSEPAKGTEVQVRYRASCL